MKNLLLILFIAIVLSACSNPEREDIVKGLSQAIDLTKAKFAPDKRVVLFEIEATHKDGKVWLQGESTSPEAVDFLKSRLVSDGYVIIDSIRLLPAKELGDSIWGVVNNSVSNLRSAPKHAAELATQATLGTPLKVLKGDGDWYLVQTPDGYIAWMDMGGFVLMDTRTFEQWRSQEKLIFTDIFGHAYDLMDQKAIVSDLVMSDLLSLIGTRNDQYIVGYPDGRKALVQKSKVEKYLDWIASTSPTGESLTELAMQMMGTPYLWGGTSIKSMDCSGFTKTVYFMHGLIIPRDASQQVHVGLLVDSLRQWETLQPGDLLFFGRAKTDSTNERVVHVGMWLGDHSFIHASGEGRVKVSNVLPESPQFDAMNTSRYLRTRRYLGHKSDNIIDLKEKLIF